MKIKCIDHVAINAKDYDAMLKFYRDFLELEQLNSVVTEDFTATYLGVPGGARIELFDLKGKTNVYSKTDDDIGVRHMAFEVENVKEHADKVVSSGIEIVLPYTELDNFKAKVILFKDPDGNVLEFCEPL